MRISFLLTTALLIGAGNWWLTPDQRGQRLSAQQEYAKAAESYEDPMRKGIAWFQAGEFEKAEQTFARLTSAEAEYNRGNCLVMLGKYEAAVQRYQRALQLRPGWEDAESNMELAKLRAERIKAEGGDMGDQKIGADEIKFDRNKQPGGQETELNAQKMSDTSMQALWLRKVQTEPADFLRAKFAYQLETRQETNE